MADDSKLKAQATAAVEQGRVAHSNRRWTDSVRHYQYALALDPTMGSVTVHRHLGVALYELGRFDEATAALDASLQLDPKHFKSLMWRSSLHRSCGRFAESLADAVAATNIDAKVCAGWINRCAALTELDMASAAVRCGKRAVKVGRKDARAHQYLARALLEVDDRAGALSHFEQAIELSSSAWLTRELLKERAELRASGGGGGCCFKLMCALLLAFVLMTVAGIWCRVQFGRPCL
jgi:tetratricopeptide (TPR) repeat protein